MSTSQHTGKASRGFTLLETLAALTILAIALVSLLGTYSTGLRTAGVLDGHSSARILAQSLLSETMSGWQNKPGSRRGRYGAFAWSITVEPASSSWASLRSKENWQLHRIRVMVEWDRSRQFELQTLKLGRANE